MKGIIGVATKAVEGAKGWIWTIFYSLMAFSVVTVFLGGAVTEGGDRDVAHELPGLATLSKARIRVILFNPG